MPVGTNIDVIGIIKDPGQCQEVNVKNSQETKGRRMIQIYDDSLSGIEVTLWGDMAHKDYHKNSIVILKNARTNEFKDTRNLTSTFQTSICFDETENEEYQKLLKWRNSVSSEAIDQIHISDKSERKIYRIKTLSQMESEANQIADSFNDKLFSDVKAHVLVIKHDERIPLYYLACQNEKCSKKVVEEMDGWKCESCNKTFKEVL